MGLSANQSNYSVEYECSPCPLLLLPGLCCLLLSSTVNNRYQDFPSFVGFFFVFFFLFFPCPACGTLKFQGQESNPHNSSNLSHSSDNPGSLTC